MAQDPGNLDVLFKIKQDDNSLRETKAALKGLALEFPELARVANLALNPISLSITAIIGALGVWKSRQEELSKAFTSSNLPDLTLQASAYHKELEKIRDTTKTLTDLSQQRVDALETELELHKQLIQANAAAGLLSQGEAAAGLSAADLTAGQAGINARMSAALALSADAQSKRGRFAGIQMMDEETEKAVGEKLKAAADDARAEIKERRETVGQLRDVEAGTGDFWTRLKWAGRIAWSNINPYANRLDTGERIQAEYEGIGRAQSNIDRYSTFQTQSAYRARARAMRGQLTSEADAESAQANEYLYGRMPGEVAAQRRREGQAPYVLSLGQLERANKNLEEDTKWMTEVNNAINLIIQGNRTVSKDNLLALQDAVRQIEADKAEISRIRQQLANMRAP